MWIQKDKLNKYLAWDEVSDWVVINGVLWVEIPDNKEGLKC